MFTHELKTSNDKVKLVKPNVQRDSIISVGWLEGQKGKDTLRLMGNNENVVSQPISLEIESERIQDFLDKKNQLNWAIQFNDPGDERIVGAIWVDLEKNKIELDNGNFIELNAPSPHIMIGETDARNQGIGTVAIQAVMDYLVNEMHSEKIYTRAKTNNDRVIHLLKKSGFRESGESYTDKDRIDFQNFEINVKKD